MKRKHYPVQCDRCYHIFYGPDRAASALELEAHRQLPDSCDLKDASLKEGISDAQWAKLDKKKTAMKSQASSKIEKYWEIWDILFPAIQHPTTPCKSPADMAMTRIDMSQGTRTGTLERRLFPTLKRANASRSCSALF